MQIESTRHVALAIAAGVWMFFTMPAHAACSSIACIKAHEENIKTLSIVTSMGASKVAPRKHSDAFRKIRKHYAHKATLRTTVKKSAISETSADDKWSLELHVANARAELQGLNVQPEDHAANIANITGMPLMDDTQIAISDQLTDADRSLNAQPETPTLQIVKTIPITSAPTVTNRDDDTWSKTSLIGQILIASGGLLAMASAARMLIAYVAHPSAGRIAACGGDRV